MLGWYLAELFNLNFGLQKVLKPWSEVMDWSKTTFLKKRVCISLLILNLFCNKHVHCVFWIWILRVCANRLIWFAYANRNLSSCTCFQIATFLSFFERFWKDLISKTHFAFFSALFQFHCSVYWKVDFWPNSISRWSPESPRTFHSTYTACTRKPNETNRKRDWQHESMNCRLLTTSDSFFVPFRVSLTIYPWSPIKTLITLGSAKSWLNFWLASSKLFVLN